MEKASLQLSVSDFIAITNQTLEYAYPSVLVEGEVSSFKVNQGKFVFFDLKDTGASVGCFMMAFQLRFPIEDGMKVVVTASPKLTQWGKFSLTVKAIRPIGEGSLKKSFELLKEKLSKEGLFAIERKRSLPSMPSRVAVISSTQAAGYADFMKIAGDRWGGVNFEVAQVQVQGDTAPDQMIRALKYINSRQSIPDVIVIIRGGGSADDLAAFNDELLVREVAASRAPVLVGIGHEVDESLVDLAADVSASTPSNAAQLLFPDKKEVIRSTKLLASSLLPHIDRAIVSDRDIVRGLIERAFTQIEYRLSDSYSLLSTKRDILTQVNPELVLRRGYSILRGNISKGGIIEVETANNIIKAEVKDVRNR